MKIRKFNKLDLLSPFFKGPFSTLLGIWMLSVHLLVMQLQPVWHPQLGFGKCCTWQWASQVALVVRTRAWSLGQEDPLEKGRVPYASILAYRIPRTEEPGGLESIGSHKIRQDWSDLACMHTLDSKLPEGKNHIQLYLDCILSMHLDAKYMVDNKYSLNKWTRFSYYDILHYLHLGWVAERKQWKKMKIHS